MAPEFVGRVLAARAIVEREMVPGARCTGAAGCSRPVAAGVPCCHRHLTADERDAAALLRRWAAPFVDRWLPHLWPACWFWPLDHRRSAHRPGTVPYLFDWQQGRCAICGRHEGRYGWGGLVQDHDHATGLVRGYLCLSCNAAEGHQTRDGRRLNYRLRPPAALLGVRLRYGRRTPQRVPSAGQLMFGMEE